MATTIAELTPDQLRTLIAEVVHEELVDLLGDPDEGLELRREFVARLRKRAADVAESGRVLSLDEAFDES